MDPGIIAGLIIVALTILAVSMVGKMIVGLCLLQHWMKCYVADDDRNPFLRLLLIFPLMVLTLFCFAFYIIAALCFASLAKDMIQWLGKED